MKESHPILLGANPAGKQVFMQSRMANRHGLIAGATGTGKTVTLQVLAEHFSALGVPVFTADVKGDLSGLAGTGKTNGKLEERLGKIGVADHQYYSSPVEFWDIYGKTGLPVRTTITSMGALLLSNLMDLSDVQDGVLHIAFRVAKEKDWPLLDLKDLRQLLNWLADNAKEVSKEYGRVSPNSIAAIQRRVLVLNDAGGEAFFGEPALDIEHLIRTVDGRGVINLLDAQKLMLDARIYGTFLVWLLTELFKNLEEVGDQATPKLVFFFDEAHLLFDSAPKVLLEKFEQIVRLIRSKGVGIYFVTQSPADVPDSVLGQCGNRIQHALRAYTPKERKAVKVAAESFRINPELDTAQTITELGLGEALVSVLDEKAQPTIVERTLLMPPHSQFGPISDAQHDEILEDSKLNKKYTEVIDRESAYEILREKAAKQAELDEEIAKQEAKEKAKKKSRGRSSGRQSNFEAATKSMLRSMFTALGRSLVDALMKALGIKKTRSRRKR